LTIQRPHPTILIRGGGDLATGVAARLHRVGFPLLILEIEQPLAVRRRVALAEAVYAGRVCVEDMEGVHAPTPAEVPAILEAGGIPVLVDAEASSLSAFSPQVIVDGRMKKTASDLPRDAALLTIGLGPGFSAGADCHAVVETRRGHRLGRVIWMGPAAADTSKPETVEGYGADRVLRAPNSGEMRALREIGDVITRGEPVFAVDGEPVLAPFDGVLRGLLHDGLKVEGGMKVGDLDPRGDPRYCYEISDKALAVGGGVLEAVLSRAELRRALAEI
jgi:xanthine dehydrogenase accessory factor